MNLYYTEIIFLVIFALIILELIVTRNEILSKEKKKQLKLLYRLVILAASTEWLGVFLNGKDPSLVFIHGIIKASEYSLVPFLAFSFLTVLDGNKHLKVFGSLLGVHAIFEFLSIFSHNIFYIDTNNYYQHGSFYWIYVLTYLLSFIYLLYYCLKFSSTHQTKNRIVLISTLILFVTGLVLRQINSSIRIDYLCTVLTAIYIYIFYVDVLQKSDALTGLLNRGSYINSVANISKQATILYFDVNNFKKINDDYGHLYGDEVLKIIGQTIKEVYEKYGRTYRIGGDEFCVIIDYQKNDIEKINQLFHQTLLNKQEFDPHLPTVSVGYSYYDYRKDAIDDIINIADKNMYRNKAKYKKETDALILREQKKSTMLNQIIQSGHFDIDFDQQSKIKNITWSFEFKKMLGYTEDEFPNTLQAWQDKIHPNDLNKTLDAFYKGIQGQQELNIKYRLLTKEKKYLWFQMTGILSKKDNIPDFYLGIIININTQVEKEYLSNEIIKVATTLEEQTNVLSSLCSSFVGIYKVNLNNETFEIYQFSNDLRKNVEDLVNEGKSLSYREMIENYISTQVVEQQQDFLRKKLAKEKILETLQKKKYYSIAFKVKDNLLHQKYFEVAIVDVSDLDNSGMILMAFRNIDDLIKYSK